MSLKAGIQKKIVYLEYHRYGAKEDWRKIKVSTYTIILNKRMKCGPVA